LKYGLSGADWLGRLALAFGLAGITMLVLGGRRRARREREAREGVDDAGVEDAGVEDADAAERTGEVVAVGAVSAGADDGATGAVAQWEADQARFFESTPSVGNSELLGTRESTETREITEPIDAPRDAEGNETDDPTPPL
jgi:hypothetical protein